MKNQKYFKKIVKSRLTVLVEILGTFPLILFLVSFLLMWNAMPIACESWLLTNCKTLCIATLMNPGQRWINVKLYKLSKVSSYFNFQKNKNLCKTFRNNDTTASIALHNIPNAFAHNFPRNKGCKFGVTIRISTKRWNPRTKTKRNYFQNNSALGLHPFPHPVLPPPVRKGGKEKQQHRKAVRH